MTLLVREATLIHWVSDTDPALTSDFHELPNSSFSSHASPSPSLSLWSCFSGIQHLCRLASSTHCHPHYRSSHTPWICLLLDPTVRVLGSQAHPHSEDTTLGKGRQQREQTEVNFWREELSKCLLIPERMSSSEFFGEKKIICRSSLFWLFVESSKFLLGGPWSVAGGKENPHLGGQLVFSRLSSSWGVLRGRAVFGRGPGPGSVGRTETPLRHSSGCSNPVALR